MSDDIKKAVFAVLPLRDIVVFPGMIAPLFIGRKKSTRALEDAIRDGKRILLLTQKDSNEDDPAATSLYEVGIVANILQLLKLPDGTVKALIEGRDRVKVKKFTVTKDLFKAEVEYFDDEHEKDNKKVEIFRRSIVNQFEQYVKLNKKISPDIIGAISQIEDARRLADTVAAHLALKIVDKQKILETKNFLKRLEMICGFLETEIEALTAEQNIRSQVRKQMEKKQKEYYLSEKLKAINELGDQGSGSEDEITELEKAIKTIKFSKEAKEKALAELKKLKNTAQMSAEATVIRNYLDWLVSVPWSKRTRVKQDILAARKRLDEDHYGLEKVKERILEYIAVQQRTRKIKGPILCLVGPPGVGKTSLAKSIAKAIGRNFVKVSLGGVRDESEIRGHRRTYIGSMPGKIMQGMKKARAINPLFLLDEIDKMGSDFRGDPSSALLEVLDSEQNSHFSDHYMEVEYDLSDVMFVATANSLNLPPPLLDRLEVIRIAGYTEDEKIEIAKRHLIDKQKKYNGLRKGEFAISDEALRDLVRYYTREAGVRNLEREIANLARKATKEILLKQNSKTVAKDKGNSKSEAKINISSRKLKKFAGVRRYSYGKTEQEDLVGVVNGLAYTTVGGELLNIEAVSIPGKGVIKSTGKLGDVMQESAQAAYSYIRSRSTTIGITPPQYQKRDIHIHVPEGATPKDGPSAGIAMCVAIASVLTNIPVKKNVAMTGEVTLRGRVLAIGGLKEKLLGALRAGIETVIIPKDNVKDLEEIPKNVKNRLEIIPVSNVDEVLRIALVKVPEQVQWVDETLSGEATHAPTEIIPAAKDEDYERITTH